MAQILNIPTTAKALKDPFVRTDPQNKAFTFRYESTGPSAQISGGNINMFITLFLNPEEFTVTEPYRVMVTQTKGGAFVDNFGQGIRTITLRGVTGFRARQVGGIAVSGQEHFLQLRNMFRQWADSVEEDGSDTSKLYFYDWQDKDYYEIVINTFNLLRSNSRPLLYQYNVTFTVVQDLTTPSQITEDTSKLSQYLTDATLRPPLILNKLQSSSFFLSNILNQLVDMSTFSSGTQIWAQLIGKGIQYYDTISGVFQTVEKVISDVNDLSVDINSFVSGTYNFIKTPFELVRNLSVSIGDCINAMCAVADVPHELVRILREMICAIQALSPTSFEGYTNPSLFEGASNCGTTLGIADAPVSTYDNSFTATSQIASDRLVSQIFEFPQAILILQETPDVVNGVFLTTDISRTGLNYLQSTSGVQVSLTAVPRVPVVVDYKVQQNTTTNRLTLHAAQSVMVLSDDTLSRIALRVYGDPTDWKLIALFNNLEYPYIVAEDFVTEYAATGNMRFFRDPTIEGDIVIPKGTSVWVPAYMGTNQIYFITTQEQLLDIGVAYVDVPIQAVAYGEIGNAAPRLITGFDPIHGIIKVLNISATRGGKIYKIMKPGSFIQIPKTERTIKTVVTSTNQTYEQLFGIDIAINKFGEFDNVNETSASDVILAYGEDNLKQALKNRIATSKGFYLYHQEYGTNLPYYIGKKNIPYWEELAKLDVQQACLLDTRISRMQSFTLNVDGDAIMIDCTAIPINETNAVSLQVVV